MRRNSANWNAERLGAVAGIAFIVLNLIGNLIAGSPPSFDDSPAKIASFFQDNHRDVIISVLCTGAAAPLFIWLLASLALRLRTAGQGAWAVIVFALGVTGWAMGVAADAVYGSLARIGTEGDAGLIQGLYQLQGFFTVKAFWFATGFALVAGIAAWQALPRWYAISSLAAGALFVLGGISVRSTGALAPLDSLTFIAFLALLAWVVATSLVVWRLSPGPEPIARATSPM